MNRNYQVAIIAIIASVAAASVASTVTYAVATEDSRKKYTTLVEQHYIQEHLEPDELTIVRIGESPVSQPLADGLMTYGAKIQSYSGFVVPSHLPTGDTIYIFEEDLMREGVQDAEFHEFLRNAISNHSLIVVVGDDGNNPVVALSQALEKAGVESQGTAGNIGGPVVSKKLSERGGAINSSYGQGDGSPTYWKDVALSILKTAREESEHTQLFQ
ncbi:MAG TPA: hypothetical protein VF172_10895 [Nitrososphaera sp.]